MNCNSLKEAIDITFEKYKQAKTEENYKKILELLLQGQYKYITSDEGTRNYVFNNLPNEIERLYDESMIGKEGFLDDSSVSLESKISSIADYLANYSKGANQIKFGTIASKIDKLNIQNKTEFLYAIISNNKSELGLTSGDIKRLVIENAYRLLRLHSSYSGDIILDLYSDNNHSIKQRVDIANEKQDYLRDFFQDIDSVNLVDFINNISEEQFYELCNLYETTRRNYKNSNYINMADTINATRETISVFDTFSNRALLKYISGTGISY